MSQSICHPIFSMPPDHLELISSAAAALTVDPYKNVLYYFFPFIGAFFSGAQRLQNNPSQEAMIPPAAVSLILRELKDLTNCAEIHCEVAPYITLSHQFSSCGGGCSATKPNLFIPDHRLFRRNGHSPFGQERAVENLRANPWILSDDETRFFIARELGQIKENSALLRVAIKVAVIGALFTIYASPFGWLLGFSLFIGVIGLHILSERLFQARADLVGIRILSKKIPNAVQVALETLEKVRQQNLYQRKNNKLAELYITERGDNLLDLLHPRLTSRIARIRDSL